MNGEQLFDLVAAYHDLGVHRAGTAVDAATVDWYDAQLNARGLRTERIPVPFDRYVHESTLTVDGEPIAHLPLFYEWTGSIDTTDVHVALVDAHSGGHDDSLADALVAGAATGREALILATEHTEGSLIACNRQPHHHGGRPTVLVGGRDHERLAGADTVRLTMTAATEPAATTNLAARNDIDGRPLLLTTPLTGWFGCAGERGTGAAVLLELVERFGDAPLLILATGGHELDYLGVRRWVAAGGADVRAIVHVGASVAVDAPDGTGGRALIPSRLALTGEGGAAGERMGRAVAPGRFHYRAETPSWTGESEVFCELGVPMLSFTGAGLDFHTPEDTPDRATSPVALATVAAAVAAGVSELWDATA